MNRALRTTAHAQHANPGKRDALAGLVRDCRAAAKGLASMWLRKWHEDGHVPRSHGHKDATPLIGSNPACAIADQVAETFRGHITWLRKDYERAVLHSSLPDGDKKVLLTVPTRELVRRPRGPEGEKLRQGRTIWRAVRRRRRLPRFGNLNPRFGGKIFVRVERAHAARKFGLWVRLKIPRRPAVLVPLQDHRGRQRLGGPLRPRSVQLVLRGSRPLEVRLFTDMTESFAASRKDYSPRKECVGLDFGLAEMFATSEGDLLGRKWLAELKRRDESLTELTARLQRSGRRPRSCPRYRGKVASLRGCIRTEVNRVLNRIVAIHGPAELAVERLDFRRPGLSRRMNRILQNCGRRAVRAKTASLRERHGIESPKVNPRNTSRTCSRCRHVDKRNRRSRSRFQCRSCGHKSHADVNAARNIRARRSRSGSGRVGNGAEPLPKARTGLRRGALPGLEAGPVPPACSPTIADVPGRAGLRE